MLYIQYLLFVQERAGLRTEDQAAQAIRTVFEVLDEAIPREQAQELAETLPAEIRDHLGKSIWARKFSGGEFVERVAEKEGVDQAEAENHVRSVLSVLADYLPSLELLLTLDKIRKDVRNLFLCEPAAA